MRTTLTLDDRLLEDLMKFTDARTRTEAVKRAVAEWVRQKRLEKLKELRGKLMIETDVAALRQLEVEEAKSLHG